MSEVEPGHFTMSLPDALRKLGEHQLKNPRTYLLKLIQWAVASRPTDVRVEVTSAYVSVAHNGVPLSEADARRLPFPGLGEAADHLAVGIRAGLALGARGVHLSAPGWGLDLSTGNSLATTEYSRVTLLEMPRPIAKTLIIHLIQGLASVTLIGLFVAAWSNSSADGVGASVLAATLEAGAYSWSFLNDAPGLLSPEVSLARFRCAYADVPIYVNGKPVNRPDFGLSSTYRVDGSALDVKARLWFHHDRCYSIPEADCRVPWVSESEEETDLPYLRMEGKACRGQRAIVVRELPGKHGYGSSKISWVKDGVIVAEETHSDWPGGYRIIACAHDLKVDVSQFNLVHDESYETACYRVLSCLI